MNNKRILIAGFEIGGQMNLLSKEFKKHGLICDSISFNQDKREFESELYIDRKGILGFFRQLKFFIISLLKYDVFYFFWGVSLLSLWRFHNIDLPILKFFNKKVVVHFRGTDVINLEYYENLRNAALGINSSIVNPMVRRDQSLKIDRFRKTCDFVLVSTPDLLFVDKNSYLFPQVVDVNEWESSGDMSVKKNNATKTAFRIAHAPTRRNVKGTDLIIEKIEELNNQGFNMELIIIENVPFNKMKTFLNDCDFGIDQLFNGWYGKISVEMMAMGKPVLCYLNEDYIKLSGMNPPIINVNCFNIKNKIIEVCQLINDSKFDKNSGIEFVKRNHCVSLQVENFQKLILSV